MGRRASGKDRGDSIFQLRGHMAHVCQCSLPDDSMPQFIYSPLSLSLFAPTCPQSVGCVIIDLGGEKSLESEPHPHTHSQTHTRVRVRALHHYTLLSGFCWCLPPENMNN